MQILCRQKFISSRLESAMALVAFKTDCTFPLVAVCKNMDAALSIFTESSIVPTLGGMY